MIELVKRRKEKMVPRSHPQNCWNWALSLPLSHLHHSYIGTSRSISLLWRQRKLERERERIPSKKRESICVSSYIYRLPNGSFPFSLVTYSAKPLHLCVSLFYAKIFCIHSLLLPLFGNFPFWDSLANTQFSMIVSLNFWVLSCRVLGCSVFIIETDMSNSRFP